MRNGHFGRGVSIIGAAYTPLGDVRSTAEILNFTERELFAQASLEAMENAGIEAPAVDAFYLGMSSPNYYSKTKSAGPHFSEWAGMRGKPTLFHDEGCGSALFGLQMAVHAVACGAYDVVMSSAVNITQSSPIMAYPPHIRGQLDEKTMWEAIHTGIDCAYEKPGIGGAGSPEALFVRYCKDYGVSYNDLNEAMVQYILNARKQALTNPKACTITETYEEEAKRFGFDNPKDYLLSDKFNPNTGTFLRIRFIGKHADGASSVIVCATELAEKLTNRKAIEVAGVSSGTMLQKTFIDFPGKEYQRVMKDLYIQGGIADPYYEIEYMGIHDCPITSVIQGGEAAGYFEPGQGWKYLLEDRVGFNGDKPVTTTGGRTQTGHPFGASFAIELSEAVDQMRGEAGPRQIKNPPRTSIVAGGGSGVNLGACLLKTK